MVSIFVTFLGFLLFTVYVLQGSSSKVQPVIYKQNVQNRVMAGKVDSSINKVDSRPFGSIHGKTYTYSWCSGSGNIKLANKVYFMSSDDAEAKGRTLSKLCRR